MHVDGRQERVAWESILEALIKTLNKTCLNGLEAAAGLCLSRTNSSVEVEHWLIKLVEVPNIDLTRIFRHFEVDTSRLSRDLTRVIDGFRTGNQRTPTLSLKVDRLLRGLGHRVGRAACFPRSPVRSWAGWLRVRPSPRCMSRLTRRGSLSTRSSNAGSPS